jgi:hypothetical protein
VLLVVEALKIFALPLQRRITWKPLSPKEFFIVSVIELFNYTVSPGFSNWNKDRLNTKIQAKPDYQTKGSGVLVTSTKAQFII